MVGLAISCSYDRVPVIVDHFVLIFKLLQESFALFQAISGRQSLDVRTLLFHAANILLLFDLASLPALEAAVYELARTGTLPRSYLAI